MNKPFKSLAFCCTSIPAKLREELSQKLTSMGGIHYSDLMSDVTYLIVGDRKTDKYNYCIRNRHDVKFLKPDAILKVYELWLSGEESKDLLDINNYLLPVFSGLVVCMSRISFHDKKLHESIFLEKFRNHDNSTIGHLEIYSSEKLSKYIEANGGKVTESLTISNSCVVTTEKKGKRYLKAVEWDIPVVHPIWVFDSMLRQVSLNLEDYHIDNELSNPNYNKGCFVWNKLFKSAAGITVTSSSATIESTSSKNDISPTKSISVRNPNIWNSIMVQQKSTTGTKLSEDNLWDENNRALEEEEDDEDDEVEDNETKAKNGSSAAPAESHIFIALNFLILNFNEKQESVLKSVIKSNGGDVTEDFNDSSITHIIIPSSSGSESSAILKTLPAKLKSFINKTEVQIVTEWFVERCVFYDKYILDYWGKPLRGILTKSPPLKKLKICITGFTGVELLHIQKLISYMGFQFCESLTASRDLMIVNIYLFKDTILKKSPKLMEYKFKDILDCPVYQGEVSFVSSKNKINAAKNWEIPIVSLAYLWETLELSMKKKVVTMPDIIDLRWCIFVPRTYQKTTTLMDFMRTVERSTEEQEQIPAEKEKENENENERAPISTEENVVRSNSGSLPQLPSPRKGSKQTFGRIVGRSPKNYQVPPQQEKNKRSPLTKKTSQWVTLQNW